jgi:hypothetical protein
LAVLGVWVGLCVCGAALVIGVLAVAFINDVLAAPDYHPVMTSRLEALRRQIMNYAAIAVFARSIQIGATRAYNSRVASIDMGPSSIPNISRRLARLKGLAKDPTNPARSPAGPRDRD